MIADEDGRKLLAAARRELHAHFGLDTGEDFGAGFESGSGAFTLSTITSSHRAYPASPFLT